MLRSVDPIPELKRQLAAELLQAIRGWPPTDLRFVIPLDQPRLSDLRRGKLKRFSLERLIRFLSRMRYNVDITVTKKG